MTDEPAGHGDEQWQLDGDAAELCQRHLVPAVTAVWAADLVERVGLRRGERLGAARHGITVWPAADIPAEWASVVAHRDAPASAGGPERFASLAVVLPDVDGAWFALAGLSSAAGESHLHVVGIGLPPPAGRFEYNWTPRYSWWLIDGAGNWHVGTAGEPWTFGDGTQAFRLRLTPPLTALPDVTDLVLTGPSTQVRVSFPMPHTA